MLTLLGKGSMAFVIQADTPVVVSRLHVSMMPQHKRKQKPIFRKDAFESLDLATARVINSWIFPPCVNGTNSPFDIE